MPFTQQVEGCDLMTTIGYWITDHITKNWNKKTFGGAKERKIHRIHLSFSETKSIVKSFQTYKFV